MAPTPSWFTQDVARGAQWLPDNIRQLGVNGAYQQRWSSLPDDIKSTITQMSIAPWMIALVPMDAGAQDEIFKQFRFMPELAGSPPANPIAARVEALLIFGGAAQLPTPGDNQTGVSLGEEGCTAAISKYVLAVLKEEFSQALAAMSDALTICQSSSQMQTLLQQAAQQGIVELNSTPFALLTAADIQPGSLTIAQKPGGTHVFGWTRVPQGWNWDPSDKMAIGNTGLPQFGDRLILAQEYVTGNPQQAGELTHNQHGPINSQNIVYVDGKPDLSNPGTNVYAVQGSNFILANLIDSASA